MNNQKLLDIGWKPFFQQQLSAETQASTFVARVSSHLGIDVLLLGEAGEFRVPVSLAESAGEIAVGDWLVLRSEDQRAIQRLDRQTLLQRKALGEELKPQAIAANIDTLFVVSSCNEDFNLSRIERYLALAMQTGATPVVVLTKADLCDDPTVLCEQAEQLHPGLSVQAIDARKTEHVEILLNWCSPGQTVALLGSSGVGKSTLGNALGADDLVTGGIREQDAKGRHTTTSRSLHRLPRGGVLIDNPGVRELQLPDCEDGLLELFADIQNIVSTCRFSNCSHEGDLGCAIKPAIESGELDERRYINFQKLNAEQARNAALLAERREQSGASNQKHKSNTSRKRRRKKG
ncbi:MAG: ribosome small subunit-dependent GTPase A [Phycisphaeraceae bacterium]